MGQAFGYLPDAFGGLINMDMSSFSSDKISVAVLKTRQLANVYENYCLDKRPDVLAHLQTQCDKLLGFLLTQFSSSPNTDDVHAMMRQAGTVNILDVDEVRVLPEAIVPIAIVRELIRTHQIPMNPPTLPNWTPFMDRYRAQVMSA